MFATPKRIALSVLLGSAVLAPMAHAESYEQISRASGTIGFGAINAPAFPGPASDTGLFGIYQQPDVTLGDQNTYRSLGRNVVSNRTSRFASGRLFAMDRAETTALTYVLDPPNTRFYVQRLTGGPATEVATLSGGGSAALSGDGKTVVIADYDGGTSRYDIETGTTTPVTSSFLGIDRFSVSDDAKVVAGFALDRNGIKPIGAIRTGGARIEVSGRAYVSPNGKTVFYLEEAAGQLVTRDVATGTETRTAIPATLGRLPNIMWISPDGTQVALSPSTDSASTDGAPPTAAAQAFHTDTGRWYRFGGAYAKYLYDGGSGLGGRFQISRNGRFATLEFNEQVALVTFGATLTGGGDPLSPAAYFGGSGPLRCSGAGFFGAYLAQPAPWIRKPRTASVRVLADGALVQEGTTTTSSVPGTAEAVDGPAFGAEFAPTVENVSVQWTVVDGLGRTYRESYSGPLGCNV